MISLPKMACEALGVDPISAKHMGGKGVAQATEDCCCSYCGRPVKTGEYGVHNPTKYLGLFMDDFDLARPGQKWSCCYCSPLATYEHGRVMQALMNTVVTNEGVYRIASLENRKYFLLNLPEPPWAMLIGEGKNDHLIWKAIPTIDNRYIQVCYSGESMVIRSNMLQKAIGWCQELTERLNEFNAKAKKNAVDNPFVYFKGKINEDKYGAGFGLLRPGVYQMDGVDELVANIHSLNRAEIWALGTILKPTEKEIVKPNKLTVERKNK